MKNIIKGFALAAMTLTAPMAMAQSFPESPITIVVPFPPGGSTDLLARKIGESMAETLGQPVVVENRGGAGGTVGAHYVTQADPDGYTLLMGVTGSNAISAVLRDDLPYSPTEDFDPVSIVISSPLVLVVQSDSDFESVQDVIDFAAENPETFTHGTPGVGTSMHMAAELFGLESGTTLLHVPYSGSADALKDLLGGQIDSMFGDILVTSEHVKAGTLRPLAVTGTQEHFLLEGVPTMAEAGLENYAAFSWQGLFAPAGTPPEVLDTLYGAVSTALATDELKAVFAERGFLVEGMAPADSKAFIASEVEKWGRVVDAAGLKQ
ncbi:Bug family tripartite tricarboxylate transporter substrate binding protein [Psychromarinibacter sp. S121]|uniref:Bug family tripartite tricarboxylate transporter substrate binding protein n=1 Tax=Psychromarinibacter sp. S121 TaxID=3415127 RepID=UPI003C7C1EC3